MDFIRLPFSGILFFTGTMKIIFYCHVMLSVRSDSVSPEAKHTLNLCLYGTL